MRTRQRTAVALLSAALLLLANASAQPPAPSRAPPAAETEEGGLWQVSDKAEQVAARSGERIRAPELEAYVQSLACKVGAQYCGDFRVFLMQRPFFNASMAPNGYMEVWSGLLLRAQDEAELAFVLGHEMEHYLERHTLDRQRAMRSRGTAMLLLGAGIAVAGTVAAVNNPYSAQSIMDATGNLIDVVYLANIAALFAFSREQEADADRLGFERAVAAGYDPAAGASLWRTLSAEVSKSDFDRVRKSQARGGIFNTHPVTAERIAALDALTKGRTLPGATEAARYRAVIRPHLGAWLRDDLRRRDYGQTLFLVEQLKRGGEDLGVLHFYEGETYRLRRKPSDLALARAAYEKARAYPDAPPALWRELGEIYKRDGGQEQARVSFETYLAKTPNAADKLMIEAALKSLPPAQAPTAAEPETQAPKTQPPPATPVTDKTGAGALSITTTGEAKP